MKHGERDGPLRFGTDPEPDFVTIFFKSNTPCSMYLSHERLLSLSYGDPENILFIMFALFSLGLYNIRTRQILSRLVLPWQRYAI